MEAPSSTSGPPLPPRLLQPPISSATSYGTFNIAPAPGQPLIPVDYGTGPNSFVMNLRVSKTFALGNKTGEHSAGDTSVNTQGIRARRGRFPSRCCQSRRRWRWQSGQSRAQQHQRFGWLKWIGESALSLTLSASGRNIFNVVNLAPPIGNLTSPLFGRSNALIGGPYSFAGTNRRIDFQVVFNF